MISMKWLSKEETKFIGNNYKSAEHIVETYESIMFLLGDTFYSADLEGDVDKDRKLRLVVFYYLMPIIVQNYRSILNSLREGCKISAGCLFRNQLEAYIDLWYLLHNQNLVGRYLDYHHIAAKWYIDSLKDIDNVSSREKEIMDNYHRFISEYKIKSDNELSSWSGVSIRKMSRSIEKVGKIIYSFYNRYSAYGHPSSNAMIILGSSYGKEIEEEVLHEVFYDSFFMGGHILMMALGDLRSIFWIENNEDYNKLYSKLGDLFKNHNMIRKKTQDWKGSVASYYGESEVRY